MSSWISVTFAMVFNLNQWFLDVPEVALFILIDAMTVQLCWQFTYVEKLQYQIAY